ncbi:variant erythrocyte surface antigen-1 family protein [Babesia caballi]|uniref:Variant erythrocyte surface antigen-1 family protein n=1 Tax=Babesia caballi TaxID=5871 RepID=A0AAV4LWZ7_BABCB|nr:variant erythrocyte surface antigen-1 family protein [Babesia caballi]
MTTTQGQKSLTNAPTNLKESIDWVLRASGYDVAGGYHKNGREAIADLAREMSKMLRETKIGQEHLETFDHWLKNDMFGRSDGPITELVKGLLMFLGYDEGGNGNITGDGLALGRDGIKKINKRTVPSPPWKNVEDKKRGPSSTGYVLTYDPDVAKWTPGNGIRTHANNFMTAVTIIILGLSYLYWACYSDGIENNECGRWEKHTIDGEGGESTKPSVSNPKELKEFLETQGFNDMSQLNTVGHGTNDSGKHFTGSMIATKLGYSFTELKEAMTQADAIPKSYRDFVSKFKMIAEEETMLRNFLRADKGNEMSYKNLLDSQCLDCTSTGSCIIDNDGKHPMTISSFFQHYPLYRLASMIYAYKSVTDREFESTDVGAMLRAVGGVTVAGGMAAGAYFTGGFGLYPVIASFFT